MLNEDEIKKISNILNNAITGKISLDCRKKLAAGQNVNVTLGEHKLMISIQDANAVVKLGEETIIEARFTPWTKVDDDYEAMILSFNDNCDIDETWFQTASSNYLSRFER